MVGNYRYEVITGVMRITLLLRKSGSWPADVSGEIPESFSELWFPGSAFKSVGWILARKQSPGDDPYAQPGNED